MNKGIEILARKVHALLMTENMLTLNEHNMRLRPLTETEYRYIHKRKASFRINEARLNAMDKNEYSIYLKYAKRFNGKALNESTVHQIKKARLSECILTEIRIQKSNWNLVDRLNHFVNRTLR